MFAVFAACVRAWPNPIEAHNAWFMREKERVSNAEVKTEARQVMRDLKTQRFSLAQISSKCVKAEVGKGKKTAKSKMVGAMAKALAKAKATKKATQAKELEAAEALIIGPVTIAYLGLGKGLGPVGFRNLIMQFLSGSGLVANPIGGGFCFHPDRGLCGQPPLELNLFVFCKGSLI